MPVTVRGTACSLEVAVLTIAAAAFVVVVGWRQILVTMKMMTMLPRLRIEF
jgi:hypothetical protein